METIPSRVTKQTDCIWLEIDQNAPDAKGMKYAIAEAKELATREDKMVMFASTRCAMVIQVTSESDLDKLLEDANDTWGDVGFVIS